MVVADTRPSVGIMATPSSSDSEHADRMGIVDRTIRFAMMTPPDVADAVSTSQVYEATSRLDDFDRVRAVLREWADHMDTTERQIRQQLADASNHGRDTVAIPTRG